MSADVPTSAAVIDRHLGARLRHLRQQRGLSLQGCGDILGVSYQQIQKYESGANRLSVGSLVRLARAFGIAPASFFDGLGVVPSSSSPDAAQRSSDNGYPFPDYALTRSIARMSPLLQQLLSELVLAIEQGEIRRSSFRSPQPPTPPIPINQDC